MSDPLGPWELRAKCSEALHRKLHTFAMASGKEAAEVIRELAQEWIGREEHAHTMRCRLLAGEGIEVDGKGIPR